MKFQEVFCHFNGKLRNDTAVNKATVHLSGKHNWCHQGWHIQEVLIWTFTCCLLPNIYLFKVNNRNTRKRCKIYSKSRIKTPERRQWRHSGVFIVNFEQIFASFSSVSIADFERVNVSWAVTYLMRMIC